MALQFLLTIILRECNGTPSLSAIIILILDDASALLFTIYTKSAARSKSNFNYINAAVHLIKPLVPCSVAKSFVREK